MKEFKTRTKTYAGMTYLIRNRLYTNLLMLVFILIMAIIARIEHL